VTRLLRILAILWALPYTLLGLSIGLMGLSTGGGARRLDGVLEFHGGAIKWLLTRLPIPGAQHASAITLGHTVLGQTEPSLDRAHDHEMVHVRQYERWGPLMGPAYLACSLFLWLRGRDPYRGNPFEREAYGQAEHDP
jgi:hypothetical protein